MPQTIKHSSQDMVLAAKAANTELTASEAIALQGDPGVDFVDLRDPRELERDGRIPGAFHCPRGMLEFWVDPASPYHKPVFASAKQFVFYCQSGWRSALSTKTVQDMGLPNVAHIGGGFSAWTKAGGEKEDVKPKAG